METQANIKLPKVIFLDAVGTLFGVRGSVGTVYGEVAEKFGVKVAPDTLDSAFYQTFKSAPPLVFPGMNQEEVPKYEFEWWQEVALRTFHKVGVLHEFLDFSVFFEELFAYFATDKPWIVYPDVLPALRTWKRAGIELGIISNFDSRIHAVLSALDLGKFFTSITISAEVGIAKPGTEIFAAGLQKHNCSGELAWHIGDNLEEDYQGARAAGLRPILIQRQSEVS